MSMSIAEYSKQSGLSADKVRKLCRTGELNAEKIKGTHGPAFWVIKEEPKEESEKKSERKEESGWSEKKIERKQQSTTQKNLQKSRIPETTSTDPETEGMSTIVTILCFVAVPAIVLGLLAVLSRN